MEYFWCPNCSSGYHHQLRWIKLSLMARNPANVLIMHTQIVEVFRNKVIFFLSSTCMNSCEYTIFLLWMLKHTYHLQILRKLTNSFWQIGDYSIAKWHWETYTVPNSILYWRKYTTFSHCRSSLYTSWYRIWGKAFFFLFYNTLVTTTVRNPRGN